MNLSKERAVYLYDRTLQVSTNDWDISEDEIGILIILSQSLGLTNEERIGAHLRIRNGSTDKKIDPENNEQDIYRSALIAALHDETISDDELAILDTLAESMQLTNLERNAVLTMVKSEENQGIDGSRLDRLERFLNRTMN